MFPAEIALCQSESKTIQFNGCSLFLKVPFKGCSVERAYTSICDSKLQTLQNDNEKNMDLLNVIQKISRDM